MDFYFIVVIILMVLAVMGLIVGVSNDAANFLNSAIGSKAAPHWVIMTVASVGIIMGAISASSMMEIARSGIFSPGEFFFAEVMVIFMATMFTNVILLDLYNSFGLPTSTTVALVFSLLGSALGIGLIKVLSNSDIALSDLGNYIKTGKVLGIIAGILLSVVIAFISGTVVQFLTRMLFSFRYKQTMKLFGGIFAGLAITCITYFILIKGLKGSSFSDAPLSVYLKEHSGTVLLYTFIGFSILTQLLIWFTRVNVLKVIVLVGTFSLALAFAGNDLINFIGVPMAGLSAYNTFVATPGADPLTLTMESLNSPVDTPPYYLFLAGGIMVLTLWFSRKARRVTDTEVGLARQGDNAGVEKFGSTLLSRSLVRTSINTNKAFSRLLPETFHRFVDKRFLMKRPQGKDAASFDLLRASVNLTLGSVLIALGTSLKLPLSTTYVTFMVAMGSSLADRAWGRDSAVYRITGVLTVISGWFLTAAAAFILAIIIAITLQLGGHWGMIIMTSLAAIFVIHSNFFPKKTETPKAMVAMPSDNLVQKCINDLSAALNNILTIYTGTIVGLTNEDRKVLKSMKQLSEELLFEARELKSNIHFTLSKLQRDEYETGHFYVMVIDYLREIAYSLQFMTDPSYTHIENNHKGLSKIQASELLNISDEISKMFSIAGNMIELGNYSDIPEVIKQQQVIIDLLDDARKNQVKRIRNEASGTRNSVLYLSIINETKNLMLQTVSLLKALRNFSGQD